MSQPVQLSRPLRSRDLGVTPGVLPAGHLNGLSDVPGVGVGHFTLYEGENVRTGVTAIAPHPGNAYQEKTPAAVVVGNGFGKLMGTTQVEELGEIETPILLTNTLSVVEAAGACVSWTLDLPGNENVRTVNPIVGETNDGYLNDIRRRTLQVEMARQAIEAAYQAARQESAQAVDEGCIGAGTGTTAFGWKGGIGTSSRRLPEALGGYTAGVLVQTNFAGVLQICGQPLGQRLGRYYLKDQLDPPEAGASIMIVLATDAPISDRNLKRMARRALAGLARTGSAMTNGSGDYVIAFSTAEAVRRTSQRRSQVSLLLELPNDRMSPLFQAAIEATEEAIYNSLFRAVTMQGYLGRVVDALPLEPVRDLFSYKNN